MQKKLEMAANVAIILAVVAVVGVIVKREFFAKPDAGQPIDLVGKKLPLADVNWAGSETHLVLAVAKGCHFCSESADFYKRLSEATAGSRIHIVAVLPQNVSEGREYLTGLGLDIADIRQAELAKLGIDGTPTLILVDGTGTVKQTWEGKLPPEGEAEVFSALHLKSS